MMISYSQNMEDVILKRALEDIEHGFYIDIGAQDPVYDSVSLSFYQLGWRGVHVEPTAAYAAKLRESRTDEDVIEMAVSNLAEIDFYEIPDTGLSTGDKDIAKRHQENDFSVKEIKVPCISMSDLLDTYADREIHWLKIDVEGMEQQVLESWDPSEVRPWILVLESTLPGTNINIHHAWENLVLNKGYDFAHFDGVNRYYVHESHSDVKARMELRLSVFDDVVLSGDSSSPIYARIRQQRQDLEKNVEELKRELVENSTALAHLQEKLERENQARADLERLIAEKDSDSDYFRDFASKHDLAVAELTEKVGSQFELIKKLNNQIATNGDELRTLREYQTRLDARNLSLERDLSELEASKVALEGQLTEASSELVKTREEILALEESLQSSKVSEASLSNQLHELYENNAYNLRVLDEHAKYIDAVRKSISWRITFPLRVIWGALKFEKGSFPRSFAATNFVRIADWIAKHPRIESFVIGAFGKFPKADQYLRNFSATERNRQAISSKDSIQSQSNAISEPYAAPDIIQACELKVTRPVRPVNPIITSDESSANFFLSKARQWGRNKRVI